MKDAVEKYALENNTKLSFSFGYALFSADQDQTLGDTLKRADTAMYDMKRKRKAMGPKLSLIHIYTGRSGFYPVLEKSFLFALYYG